MDNEKLQDLMLEHFGKVLNKLDGMESRLRNVVSLITLSDGNFGNDCDGDDYHLSPT